jgi:ketosteroid isomerase-like protein
LENTLRRPSHANAAGNLNGLVELYTADACRMPPNAMAVQGKEGLLAQFKMLKDQFQGAKTKLALTVAESSGNLGYGTGTYVVTAADGKQLDRGKWMVVSKKVNGKWKTQCDIWNSDMAMPSEKSK